MKIIDGKKYVNEEEAVNAMLEELKKFEDTGDSSISLIIGMTIMSFMSTLFKGEEKDEHQ